MSGTIYLLMGVGMAKPMRVNPLLDSSPAPAAPGSGSGTCSGPLEPPCSEPYARWHGGTKGASPPPTRSAFRRRTADSAASAGVTIATSCSSYMGAFRLSRSTRPLVASSLDWRHGSHGLSEAAMDAVRSWRFDPATDAGKPVSVIYHLTVNFRLDSGEETAEPKSSAGST